MKILVIGGATQDIYLYGSFEVIKHDSTDLLVLPEDTKIEVSAVSYTTGGGATNTAVSFKRLGLVPSIVSLIGNDPMGRMILDDLAKEEIDTQFIHILNDQSSGLSCILPTQKGKRTILAHRGVNTLMNQQHIPFQAFSLFEHMYISSLSGSASQTLLPIVQKAKKFNITIATNPGGSQLYAGKGAQVLYESLPFIDTFILNAQEANQFMSILPQKNLKKGSIKNAAHLESLSFDLASYCMTLFALGVKIVVVTNGAHGVYVAHQNKIYFHPALTFEVKNTVGAGDSFGSTFTASLANGLSIEQALHNGMINSASVLSHRNAKEGLLTWQELISKSNAAKDKIELFDLFS